MKIVNFKWGVLGLVALFMVSCSDEDDNEGRNDNAYKLNIPVAGSLQNPSFSPDGKSIVFTSFRDGYNQGAADIFTYNLVNGELDTLVSDGSVNTTTAGLSWNGIRNEILFSSDRSLHPEVYLIKEDSTRGSETMLTRRSSHEAYSATYSPDGEWAMFESHVEGDEGNGVIMKHSICRCTRYYSVTDPEFDCRKPNWSPQNDWVVYQRKENNKWDLWLMDIYGINKMQLVSTDGNNTNAVISADGKWVYYCTDLGVAYSNIFMVSIDGRVFTNVTKSTAYDGSFAISPDESKIVFESSEGDPDVEGTTLWVMEL